MHFDAFDFAERGLDRDHLALDFANSARGHRPIRHEFLNTYADLLSWGVTVGLLTWEQADALYAHSQRAPDEAADVLRRAIALREAIYTLLENASAGEPMDAMALTELNTHLPGLLARATLRWDGLGVALDWPTDTADLGQLLGPVVWSAIDLLRSDERARVHVCEADTCDWVFLDTSRNHSRRWCSMETCGNRAKARRHYQRKASGDGG